VNDFAPLHVPQHDMLPQPGYKSNVANWPGTDISNSVKTIFLFLS
jgi:hypothetical protein